MMFKIHTIRRYVMSEPPFCAVLSHHPNNQHRDTDVQSFFYVIGGYRRFSQCERSEQRQSQLLMIFNRLGHYCRITKARLSESNERLVFHCRCECFRRSQNPNIRSSRITYPTELITNPSERSQGERSEHR